MSDALFAVLLLKHKSALGPRTNGPAQVSMVGNLPLRAHSKRPAAAPPSNVNSRRFNIELHSIPGQPNCSISNWRGAVSGCRGILHASGADVRWGRAVGKSAARAECATTIEEACL
jgi:hypothetical protein